jgi:hypothetical protein
MWIGKDRNSTQTPVDVKWVKEVHALGIFFSYDTDSVVQKNFMDRAKEFERILNMWSQRDLSLIGKITVLKSLAFSKVTYQSGTLTTPAEFIKTIIDIAYKFVWQNKPEKIKRSTLIADYDKGGLKMLEIGSFLKAQKAIWVKRLSTPDNASWKAAPKFYLQQFLGENTFKCNMDCKDKPRGFPHFYWQVLQSWFEIKKITEEEHKTPMDIRRECLWLNRHIKVKKQVVKWKNWHEKGINLIHDLVDENGNFVTFKNLEETFGIKSNALTYNALKDAIPPKWRLKLKTMKIPKEAVSFNEEIHLKISKEAKNINKITNRDLYWTLIKKIQVEPIFIEKLQNDLGIKSEEWENIFTIPKIMMQTKIRTFQYKLLFSLLPCNWYLKRIQKSETDKCNICQELDDTAHYMFECPGVVPFWNSFMNWWNNLTDGTVFLDKRSALTGFVGPHRDFQTLNTCLLLAKWHVYRSKLGEAKIFFYNYLCDVRNNLAMEKTIAIKNNKMEKFVTKWQAVEDYIT